MKPSKRWRQRLAWAWLAAYLALGVWLAPWGQAMAQVNDDSCGEHVFREAMAQGDLPRFEALLKSCGKPALRRADGSSLLHVAAHVGGRHAVYFMQRLLAAGADVQAATGDGVTAMHMAARFDCAECIPVLLRAGAPLQPRDPDGMTPLHEAGPNAALALLAAGADPLARDAAGNVPFHWRDHVVLQVAGVNVRNTAGMTPLHFAAMAGNEARIDRLLAAGADPTLRTEQATHWRSPIMSRAFGPGLEVPAGATAYDLARQQQKATRWVTHKHDAAVARLEAVTPRSRWKFW